MISFNIPTIAMREKRESSRKSGSKVYLLFRWLIILTLFRAAALQPQLEDVVVGKRVLWKFNQKNSHILPLLLDYISTFWSFVSFRNSAAVSTHARRSDGERTRTAEELFFLIFRRFQQQEKKCFSSSIFEGEVEFMWKFFPVWDFFSISAAPHCA